MAFVILNFQHVQDTDTPPSVPLETLNRGYIQGSYLNGYFQVVYCLSPCFCEDHLKMYIHKKGYFHSPSQSCFLVPFSFPLTAAQSLLLPLQLTQLTKEQRAGCTGKSVVHRSREVIFLFIQQQ